MKLTTRPMLENPKRRRGNRAQSKSSARSRRRKPLRSSKPGYLIEGLKVDGRSKLLKGICVYWTGKKFDPVTRRAKVFPTQASAEKCARRLVKKLPREIVVLRVVKA